MSGNALAAGECGAEMQKMSGNPLAAGEVSAEQSCKTDTGG